MSLSKWGKGIAAAAILALCSVLILQTHQLQAERREAEQMRLDFESSIAIALQAEFPLEYERFCEDGNAGVQRLAADRLYDHLTLYFTYFQELELLEGWYDETQWMLPMESRNIRSDPPMYAWHAMTAYADLTEAYQNGAEESKIKACFEELRPLFEILFQWELLHDERYENGENIELAGTYAGKPDLEERFQQLQELIMEDTAGWIEKAGRACVLLEEVKPTVLVETG